MAGETLLSSILQAPNGGGNRSSRGVFSPAVQYDDIINSILGQLSNDDTNVMRRTNSIMNNGLMTLRKDGTSKHTQEAMRDKCDVVHIDSNGQKFPCSNGVNSFARLRRCTLRESELGFHTGFRCPGSMSESHRGIKGFLVYTTYDQEMR